MRRSTVATKVVAPGRASWSESCARTRLLRSGRRIPRPRRAGEGNPRGEGSRDLPRDRRSAMGSGDRVEPRRTGVRGGALEGRHDLLHALPRRARTPRRLDAGGVRRCKPRRGSDQPRPARRSESRARGGERHASRRRARDGLDLRRDTARAARAHPGRRRLRRSTDLTAVVDEAVSVGTASFGLEAAIYLAEAHVRRGEGDTVRSRSSTARSERSGSSRRRSRPTWLGYEPLRYARRATSSPRPSSSTWRSTSRAGSASSTRRRRRCASSRTSPPLEGRTDEAHEALVEAERLDQRLGAMS